MVFESLALACTKAAAVIEINSSDDESDRRVAESATRRYPLNTRFRGIYMKNYMKEYENNFSSF